MLRFNNNINVCVVYLVSHHQLSLGKSLWHTGLSEHILDACLPARLTLKGSSPLTRPGGQFLIVLTPFYSQGGTGYGDCTSPRDGNRRDSGEGQLWEPAISKGCCSLPNRDPCFLIIIRLDQRVRIEVCGPAQLLSPKSLWLDPLYHQSQNIDQIEMRVVFVCLFVCLFKLKLVLSQYLLLVSWPGSQNRWGFHTDIS